MDLEQLLEKALSLADEGDWQRVAVLRFTSGEAPVLSGVWLARFPLGSADLR